MVTTEDEEAVAVADLVGHEETDDFDLLAATVDVVTEEQVVLVGWEGAAVEDAKEVRELAVDVAADLKPRIPKSYIWLMA